MKLCSDVRRENLARLVAEVGTQRAVSERLGKDKNQIGQWLTAPGKANARNISDETARELERAFGKPLAWMDYDHMSSPPLRLDPEIVASSLRLVRLAFLNLGLEFDNEEDGVPVAYAYEYLIQRQQRQVTPENVIDFSRALAAKLQGEDDAQAGNDGSVGTRHRRARQGRKAS